MVKFTIQRDGTHDRMSRSRSPAAIRCSIWSRAARCSTTRQLPPLPLAFTEPTLTVSPYLRLQALMKSMKLLTPLFVASAVAGARRAQNAATATASRTAARSSQTRSACSFRPATPARRRRWRCPTSSRSARIPKSIAAAKTIGEVLWDDLDFEREFYMIPRDTYAVDAHARPRSTQVPLDRWKELGADGVVVGTVRKTADGIVVEVRLLQRASAARCASARSTRGSHGR